MRFNDKFILFILVGIFLTSFINADVISLNSGGSENIIINSGADIDSFFSTLDNSSSSSSSSSTSSTSSSSSSGGSTTLIQTLSLSIVPSSIVMDMEVNSSKEIVLNITNTGTSILSFSISQSGLGDIAHFEETSIDELKPGKSAQLKVFFTASDKIEVHTGKIYIGNKAVEVVVSIRPEIISLDAKLRVLNRDAKLERGQSLDVMVSLESYGEDEFNVTLNYLIKDFEGKVYLSDSENLTLSDDRQFRKNFTTSELPAGKYILELELQYLDLVVPTTQTFEITEPVKISAKGKIIFFVVLSLFVVGIFVLGYFAFKLIRENWQELVSSFKRQPAQVSEY